MTYEHNATSAVKDICIFHNFVWHMRDLTQIA